MIRIINVLWCVVQWFCHPLQSQTKRAHKNIYYIIYNTYNTLLSYLLLFLIIYYFWRCFFINYFIICIFLIGQRWLTRSLLCWRVRWLIIATKFFLMGFYPAYQNKWLIFSVDFFRGSFFNVNFSINWEKNKHLNSLICILFHIKIPIQYNLL